MTLAYYLEIEASTWEVEPPKSTSDAFTLAKILAREMQDNYDARLTALQKEYELKSANHGFSNYTLQEVCDYRLARDHALRVLQYLRFRQGKNEDTSVANETIAADLSISGGTVKRAVATLTDCGWLINIKRVGKTTLRTIVHPSKIYGDLSLTGLTGRSGDHSKLTSAERPEPDSWTKRKSKPATFLLRKSGS